MVPPAASFEGSRAEKWLIEGLKNETLPLDPDKQIKPKKYWEDYLKDKVEFDPFHLTYPGSKWGQRLRKLQNEIVKGPAALPSWRGEKLPAKKHLKKLVRQLEASDDHVLDPDVDPVAFYNEHLAGDERFKPFHENYERFQDKFPGWLKSAIEEVLGKRKKADEDLAAFLHDREIYPEREFDDNDEVIWDTSLTYQKAEEAIALGHYPRTDPKEIYERLMAEHDEVRAEAVGADRFRKFLLHMKKTAKWDKYIQDTRDG